MLIQSNGKYLSDCIHHIPEDYDLFGIKLFAKYVIYLFQVVLKNRYVVTVDLQLPHVSRKCQNGLKQSLSTAAISVNNVSPQIDHLRNSEPSAGHAIQETVLECSPLPCHDDSDDSPSERQAASCSSSAPQNSPGDSQVVLTAKKRVSSIHQTCQQKRSSCSSQNALDIASSVGNRNSDTKKKRGMSKRSVCPVKGSRPRSPIYTRSQTCLKLRHINGRKRLFPSAIEPLPALRFTLFNRHFKERRRSLLSVQNSNVSQSDIEKAIASQYDAESEGVCTSDLDIETVGAYCEVNGFDGGPDATVGVGELNVIDESHVEIPLSDTHHENGVGDSHTESFFCTSDLDIQTVGAFCEVGDSHTESIVRDSLTENIVGNSHAKIVGDCHSEIGVDNIHIKTGTGDSDSRGKIVHDSQEEVGVCDFDAGDGTGDSHSKMGVGSFSATNGAGDSNPESGVHNSHVGDCHSWFGICGLRSEYGSIEDSHSVCGAVGLRSEVKVLDVSQSIGRENVKADVAVAASFQSEEGNRRLQVPERQKLVSSRSGTKHRLSGRPYSLSVTRSMSGCVLRNKKRVAWLSPGFEYPLHARQSSEGYKASGSTSSRHKSYKDVFVQKKATENIVSKNDRKVLPDSKCPCDTSIALNDRKLLPDSKCPCDTSIALNDRKLLPDS
jgi:hypothetical protein